MVWKNLSCTSNAHPRQASIRQGLDHLRKASQPKLTEVELSICLLKALLCDVSLCQAPLQNVTRLIICPNTIASVVSSRRSSQDVIFQEVQINADSWKAWLICRQLSLWLDLRNVALEETERPMLAVKPRHTFRMTKE